MAAPLSPERSSPASAHLEALELLAGLLAEIEADAPPDEFHSRLCEAICRLTAMSRAVIVRYDETRRVVRAVGAYGIELERFSGLHLSPHSAEIARRALAEDRVLESRGGFEGDLPPQWTELLRDVHLVCIPMNAAERQVGVVVCERAPAAGALRAGEPELLWMLGKMVAVASVARIATAQGERARQLEHRIALAREIHDGVVQRLFGVSLALAAEGPLDEHARVRCAAEVGAALEDLRAAIGRPLGGEPPAPGLGLAAEVQRLADAHPELGIVVDGDPAEVPEAVEPLAQSVFLEAVRNVRKHASPTRVGVATRHGQGTFVLEVVNDGVRSRPRHGGMGLRLAGMQALALGGMVEFGSLEGGQWRVRLVVPDAR